nr:hypothetical protein [Tanacetum cinerariifolium]
KVFWIRAKEVPGWVPEFMKESDDESIFEEEMPDMEGEYLLEFTSEYGISDDVHPELTGPEDRIVDFSEGLPVMPLYGDNDLTIMKFIHALVE